MEQSQSNLLSCFSSTAPWNAPAPAAPADVLKSLSSSKISTPITKGHEGALTASAGFPSARRPRGMPSLWAEVEEDE